MTSAECKKSAAALLEKDYQVWDEHFMPGLTASERFVASDAASEAFHGDHAPEFAAACQCFFIFRRLHTMAGDYPAAATLLGDYYFSRFSHYLIPLDSVPLIDAFSAYLKKDIQSPHDVGEYIAFLYALTTVLV